MKNALKLCLILFTGVAIGTVIYNASADAMAHTWHVEVCRLQ